MRRTWCSFSTAALVIACGGGGSNDGDAGGLSREAAAELVVDQLVTSGDAVVVLGAAEPLAAGERIVAYHPHPELESEVALAAEGASWFFWVDDEPLARFDHASRFAIVDRASGEVTVIDARWWPTRGGVAMWDDAAYASEVDWVYGDLGDGTGPRAGLVPELSPLADCVAAGGHAVVINGVQPGQKGRADFDKDGANMNDALTDAGLDTTYFGPTGSEGIDAPLTPATLENYFAQQATELGPGDTLVVYVNGHGWVSEEGRPGETQVGMVWETDLERWLAAFDPAVNVVVMIDGCHSGGMLDSLSCVADLAVTATDEATSSYGDLDDEGEPNPQDTGGEWTSSILTCWNDLMQSDESRAELDARAQSASTGFFTQLVSECFAGAHALDRAELRGLSHPQQQDGAAKTKIAQDSPQAPMCTPVEPTCTKEQAVLENTLRRYLTGEPDAVCEAFVPLEAGNVVDDSFGQSTAVAEGNVDGRMFMFGYDLGALEQEALACSEQVICDDEQPFVDEGFFIAMLALGADVDEIPELYYQYAFVFDQDGDPKNNYQAADPYIGDFFDDTDLWFQLFGEPGQPWRLEVVDARNGKLLPMSTAARVVIDDNVLLAVIPSALVAGASDMRFTAFRHEGDYGQSLPWSGDVMPPIDEPKFPIPD